MFFNIILQNFRFASHEVMITSSLLRSCVHTIFEKDLFENEKEKNC